MLQRREVRNGTPYDREYSFISYRGKVSNKYLMYGRSR